MKESFCEVDGLELGSGKAECVEQPAFLAGVSGPIQTKAVTARRKQPQIGGQGTAVDLQRLFQLVEAAEENIAHRISARVGLLRIMAWSRSGLHRRGKSRCGPWFKVSIWDASVQMAFHLASDQFSKGGIVKAEYTEDLGLIFEVEKKGIAQPRDFRIVEGQGVGLVAGHLLPVEDL